MLLLNFGYCFDTISISQKKAADKKDKITIIMTIAAEEKFNPELWWVLEEINKEHQAIPKEELVEFWIKTNDTPTSPDHQKKLIRKLEKDYGVIKIHMPLGFRLSPESPPLPPFIGTEIKGFQLKILQPKFDTLYQKYKSLASNTDNQNNSQKTGLQNNLMEPAIGTLNKNIFVSKDYGIYLNQNTKKPNYPIRGKKRPNILYHLRDGKKDANILCGLLHYAGFPILSKEIDEINKNFRKKLELKSDLIIHRETGGYSLNSDEYNIKFIDF